MLCTIVLSAVLMAGLFLLLFAGVALIQDKKYFTSAPKDIWEAILPHEERFPGAHVLGWALGIAAMLMMLGAVLYAGWDGMQNSFAYMHFFVRYVTMFLLLEAFDILFFDLFLLTHSRFYQHYYPETEGCAGFHRFGFNWKSHLAAIVLCPLAAAVLAYVCTLL